METIQYLRALARSWFIVLITLLAGGAGGYFAYHHATPQYRSSIRMIVSGNGGGQPTDEVTARILATQRALALSQVAATSPAIKAAAQAAGYPAASPAVSSTSDDQGPFLTVTVVDTRPARAHAIADAYARILPDTLVRLEGRADTSISVSALSPATLPSEPFSPRLLPDVGLGLAAGLVLGIAIALLREAIDRTIRDTDELERISGLSAVGTVPRGLPKQPLPVNTRPRSARAEAYRQIRTTLLNAESQPRSIAITSASAGEGKTSVAANLAAVFSRAGHRIALVDADLRRPRVAAVMEVRAKPGLSDVLARRVSLEEALIILDDGRLAVLPSGTIPANPSEALGGAVMGTVLERLKRDYEYVFIDTPPVLPVTDALVVAPMVDGVVLVTRLGRTTRERVRRAQAAIRRVNATIFGVVPNQAGKGADRDYRYGYKYAGSHKKGDKPAAEIDADTLLAPGQASSLMAAETTARIPPVQTQFREPPSHGAEMGGALPVEPSRNGAPKHQATPEQPYFAPPWTGS